MASSVGGQNLTGNADFSAQLTVQGKGGVMSEEQR